MSIIISIGILFGFGAYIGVSLSYKLMDLLELLLKLAIEKWHGRKGAK